jgi:uncharacterized protein DUF6064
VQLPFTAEQFLDVFGAYNAALWPFIVALWLLTAWATIQLVRGRARGTVVSLLAAAHWAWSGVIYHAMFFSRVNPAAWWFAVMFVAQAFAFVWLGVLRKRLTFEWRDGLRHGLASLFLAYSLVYPGLVVLTGHAFPRGPAAAVPCPTTLFTTGLLLAAAPPVPRVLLIIPIAWSLIGGSAAVLLGMAPDLMLLIAAALLTLYAALPQSLTGNVRA